MMLLSGNVLPEGIRVKVEAFDEARIGIRPRRRPKDLARIHPARRVSRWRAPALSDGLGRIPDTARAALLADRPAIGETELFPDNNITV
jgi:hypothetical protein